MKIEALIKATIVHYKTIDLGDFWVADFLSCNIWHKWLEVKKFTKCAIKIRLSITSMWRVSIDLLVCASYKKTKGLGVYSRCGVCPWYLCITTYMEHWASISIRMPPLSFVIIPGKLPHVWWNQCKTNDTFKDHVYQHLFRLKFQIIGHLLAWCLLSLSIIHALINTHMHIAECLWNALTYTCLAHTHWLYLTVLLCRALCVCLLQPAFSWVCVNACVCV